MTDTDSSKKDKHFSKLFNVVVKSGLWAQLNPKAMSVYVVLHSFIDDKDRRCWPTNGEIARLAGINERTVPAATDELVDNGLIKKWRHGAKNFYVVHREDKLKDLLPSEMDMDSGISKRNNVNRERGHGGRFVKLGTARNPSLMEEVHPYGMDTGEPVDMDVTHPNGMEAKKNHSPKNSKKEPEKNQRKKFTPPSIDEVRQYFIEKSEESVEAEKFWNFYDCKDWKVGGDRMERWKSAANGWILRNKERKHEKNQNYRGNHNVQNGGADEPDKYAHITRTIN